MTSLLIFLAVLLICAISDILMILWIKQIISRKPIRSALVAGTIRLFALLGGWIVFVDQNLYAAAGMVIGDMIGSYLGVKIDSKDE